VNPRVKSAAPRDGCRLEMTSTNGEIGIFDCSRLLSFGVFRALRDSACLASFLALPREKA